MANGPTITGLTDAELNEAGLLTDDELSMLDAVGRTMTSEMIEMLDTVDLFEEITGVKVLRDGDELLLGDILLDYADAVGTLNVKRTL